MQAWTSKKAREVVSLGRELLGGNGILVDFLVAKVRGVQQLLLMFLHDTHKKNKRGKETKLSSVLAALSYMIMMIMALCKPCGAT